MERQERIDITRKELEEKIDYFQGEFELSDEEMIGILNKIIFSYALGEFEGEEDE